MRNKTLKRFEDVGVRDPGHSESVSFHRNVLPAIFARCGASIYLSWLQFAIFIDSESLELLRQQPTLIAVSLFG